MLTDAGGGLGDGGRIDRVLKLWAKGMSVPELARFTDETLVETHRLLKLGQKAIVANAEPDEPEE